MILVQVGAFTSEVLGVTYLEKDVPAVLLDQQLTIKTSLLLRPYRLVTHSLHCSYLVSSKLVGACLHAFGPKIVRSKSRVT